LNYREGRDLVEVRLVSNGYCRQNGWRNAAGKEQWDSVKKWSESLVRHNIGYRMLRADELADANALIKEKTPIIIDNVGCVSEKQFQAIDAYLKKGGVIWLALPFGIKDEKGFKRAMPLSDELMRRKYKNLVIVDAETDDPLTKLITERKIKPALTQTSGDAGWAARIRFYNDKPVIHLLNTALVAVPHPTVKTASGVAVLQDIHSKVSNNNLEFQIDTEKLNPSALTLMSPELDQLQRKIEVNKSRFNVNLDGVDVYAVLQ